MARPNTKYFAAAAPHAEIPGAYLGSFGLPGEVTQWVMERGQQKVFGVAEDAELAGYRILMSRLNGARNTQTFVPRRSVVGTNSRKQLLQSKSDGPTVESVFGRKE